MRDLTRRALALLVATACSRADVPLATETPQIPSVICGNGVSPITAKITVGDTVRFTADICRASGPVRWSVSQTTVAEIDSVSGLLRARAVGSATVIAANVSDPNLKGVAAVEVLARP